MKCPVDDTVLVVTDRSGVEIDYCATCRGVWLDRGEIDKIIDHASAPFASQRRADDRHDVRPGRGGKRRRAGFLGELFDF